MFHQKQWLRLQGSEFWMIFLFSECQMAKEKYFEYATLSVETASCHVFADVLEIRSPDASNSKQPSKFCLTQYTLRQVRS